MNLPESKNYFDSLEENCTPNLDYIDSIIEDLQPIRGIPTGVMMRIVSFLVWMYTSNFSRILELQDQIPTQGHGLYIGKLHQNLAKQITDTEAKMQEQRDLFGHLYGQIAGSDICPSVEELVQQTVTPRASRGEMERWQATVNNWAEAEGVDAKALITFLNNPKDPETFGKEHKIDPDTLADFATVVGRPPNRVRDELIQALAKTWDMSPKAVEAEVAKQTEVEAAKESFKMHRLQEHKKEIQAELEASACALNHFKGGDLNDRLTFTILEQMARYLDKKQEAVRERAFQAVGRMSASSSRSVRKRGSQQAAEQAANARLLIQAVHKLDDKLNAMDQLLQATNEVKDTYEQGQGTMAGIH